MNEKRFSELKELIENATERVGGKEAWKTIRADYIIDPSKERLATVNQHQQHTGIGVNLYSRMLDVEADESELMAGAVYLLGALDSRRCQLSIQRIKEDYRIEELRKKYPPEQTNT